jgi:hypothetical protein
MGAVPLKAIQDSVESIRRIWVLEREIVRLRAAQELRRRVMKSAAWVLALFCMLQALALAVFWGSVGIMQSGKPLGLVVAMTSGPLLVAAGVLSWVGRTGGRKHG